VTANGPVRVHVLVRARATIVHEISVMLADALRGLGAEATSAQFDDVVGGPGVHADLVVLVGSGPEFLSARVVVPAGARVALWLLDPLPPPGVEGRDGRRGTRLGDMDDRLRLPDNRSGAFLRRFLPLGLRTRIRHVTNRLVVGRRTVIPGTDPRTADTLFFRLSWVRRRYAQGRIHHVLGTNSAVVRVLAEHGLPASRAPVGYHPALGADEHRLRDLDVVFLGKLDGDRAVRFSQLESGLARRGIFVHRSPARCFGEERAAFLNRAKVCLNLQDISWHPALVRFVLASACGALVVSESPIENTEPFVPGVHFVAARPHELADTVAALVADERARRGIVDAATQLLATEVSMNAVAARLLTLGASQK
jgi:Glycosyl transferases group 1